MAKITEFLKASQYVLVWGLAIAVAYWLYQQRKVDPAYENAIRQLDGKFTEQEKQLMAAKQDLGQLQSTVATKDEMIKALKKSKLLDQAELNRQMKKFDVNIDTFATIVANLPGHTEGGISHATPHDDTYAFSWVDEYDRFHLNTPDIKKDDATKFDYNQWFLVEAVTFKQKPENGQIKVEDVRMAETDKSGNVIQNMVIDTSRSDFKFDIVPPNPPKQGQKFVAGFNSNAEFMGAWEPKRLFNGQMGWGPAVFGDKDHQYAGGEVTYYPKIGSTNFELGVGVSGGYGTGGKSAVRAHILFTVATGK